MALTRKQLKDMQLEENVIEEIIAAHAASIEGLIAERDAARESAAEADTLRQERDELLTQAGQLAEARAEAEAAKAALAALRAELDEKAQEEALRAALKEAGCNEAAIDLLIHEISPDDILRENGRITNMGELIASLREKHAAFFAQPRRIPTTMVAPPISSGGALTLADLSHMSTEEINRNWSAVKGVLSKGVI